MDNFGSQLAELRKKRKLSQAELASAAGVSQTTVSRLESSESIPQDIRLLSKVAKALGEPLNELIPDGFVRDLLQSDAEETFFAFCPNPFCSLNQHGVNANGPYIRWTSSAEIASSQFEEVNFCIECGSELVKECPSCKRRFFKNSKFCRTCGARVCNRPSDEEWEQIRLLNQKPEESGESDIPF